MIEKLGGEYGTAVALGNFDGLHKGHIQVLKKTAETAKKKGLVPAVLLFDKHPKKVLCGKRPPMLMTDAARDSLMESMGFKIFKVSFEEFKDKTPQAFLMEAYCALNVRAICCGFNYRYGKNGAGNAETLKTDCEKLGIELHTVSQVDFEGEPISSTRIRKALESGDVRKANQMLGRPFSYKIEVVSGDKRGRLLGYPTINQFFPEDFVTARFGVYASKVFLGGKWYAAVTNIGIRPTINTKSLRSETCILGFSGDLYGLEIEVFLLDFIRDEKKFEGLEMLSAAIKADAQKAQKIYSEG